MKRLVFILVSVILFCTISQMTYAYDDTYFIEAPNGFLADEVEDASKAVSMVEGNLYMRSVVSLKTIRVPIKVTRKSDGNYFMWSDIGFIRYLGKVGYCIDPLVKIKTTANYGEQDFSTVLTQEKRDTLTLIMHYGYTYPGHQTDDYWLATQKLIWQSLGYTVKYYAKNSNFTGNYSVADEENEIQRLIANHNKRISFDGVHVDLMVGESVTLIDEEGVLTDYVLGNTPSGVTVALDGNSLTLTAVSSVENEKITLRNGDEKVDGAELTVHRASGSQTFASIIQGSLEPLLASLEVSVQDYGELVLSKVDADDASGIENVEFTIAKDRTMQEVVAIMKTNQEGIIHLDQLVPGTYYYQETNAVVPYIRDVEVHSFTIVEKQSTQIVETNEKQKVRITICKKDIETGDIIQGEASLQKAEYDILKADKKTVIVHVKADGQYVEVEEPLDVNTVYYVKETVAPQGMELSTELIEVYVPFEENNEPLLHKEVIVYDQVIKNQISIQKYVYHQAYNGDERTRYVGEGFQFEIYDTNEELVDTIVTDAQGIGKSIYLPYGTYVVKEVAKEGYQTISPFEVCIDSSTKTYSYTIENEPIVEKLQIVKVDKETQNIIRKAGFGFSIYDEYGQLISQKDVLGNEQTIFYTDDTGTITLYEPLVYGRYTIKEVETIAGYSLNSEVISFVVDGSVDTRQITIENTAKKGKIGLYKYGDIWQGYKTVETEYGTLYQSVYQEEYLANCVFEIRAKEDVVGLDQTLWYHKDEVVDTLVTSSEGVVVSKELPLGSYYVQEIQATDGYVLSSKRYDVVLENLHEEMIVEILHCKNERVKGKITFDKDLENSLFVDEDIARKDVVFGLFTNEETEIPKDSLVAIASSDEKTYEMEIDRVGSYYVKELSTHQQYQLDEQTYAFVYDGNKDLKLEETIENRVKRVNLEIVKVDAKNQAIAGVEFQLASDADMCHVLASKTTDSEGKLCFEQLEIGTYYVQEVGTPNRYVLDDTVHEIVVEKECVYTFVNQEKEICIQVEKVDEEGMPLANAVFQLIDESGRVQITETDERGMAYFTVSYGAYTLQEIQAPYGYQLEDEVVPIVVDENLEVENKVFVYKVVNTKIPFVDTSAKERVSWIGVVGSVLFMMLFIGFRLRC